MTTGQRHEEITGGAEPTSGQIATLLSEFKAYTVIEHNLDDSKLTNILKGAISAFENYTKHPLYFKRIAVYVTSMSGRVELPLLPCSDFAITVNDVTGFTDFVICGKGCVSFNTIYKAKIEYTAGYSFDDVLNKISLSYIKTGLFEYAKMLAFSEYQGIESDLQMILENRFKNLYLDAYCSSLI